MNTRNQEINGILPEFQEFLDNASEETLNRIYVSYEDHKKCNIEDILKKYDT